MSRCAVMGVVNITPDSFSDGGRFLLPDQALTQVETLASQGAEIVDLGAESTRPGADPVDAETEWRRLAPVLEQIVQRDFHRQVAVSIDTRHIATIRRALDFKISYANNVAGLYDDETLNLLAKAGVNYICMHAKGTPKTMQQEPLQQQDAVKVVAEFFRSSRAKLLAAGFREAKLFFDPGIGFGKSDGANQALLAATGQWHADYQLAVGVSRKSMFKRLFGAETLAERDRLSKVCELQQIFLGAKIIRTHDVASLVRLRQIWQDEGSFSRKSD